jgi:threonine dehydrogenase-like Zn-dependent dehydrogenase
MRALVITGPGSARVQEVEEPVPGAGQVVVDVRRAGICGTDAELFTGQLAYFGQGKTRFPVRPGHEWCGVVSAAGAGVPAEWLGVRVTGDTMLGCGRCARCLAGRGHVCADRYEVGIMGGWPGALAEKVRVPASSLHRLPDALDDLSGALVEPGGNAWRAASAAQAGRGRRVLVCGPGTIGLLTTAFAAAAGAEVHILAVDGSRRALASSFGATGYWTADDPPPVTYDAVVDGTDDHRVPAAALALAEPAGRVVFIGVSGVPSLIDSRDLVLSDMTAVGILGASAGLAPAIEHYTDGRVDPSGLVSVTLGLDQAAEALAGQISAAPGTKIHIDPARLVAMLGLNATAPPAVSKGWER